MALSTGNNKNSIFSQFLFPPGRHHVGRDPEDGAQPAAAGGGHHVRAALERPAEHARTSAFQTRSRMPVRPGRHPELLGHERHGLRRSQPRGEGRGLRGLPRREVHHSILRAELLRLHGQQGGLHNPEGFRLPEDGAQVHDLRGRSPPQRQADGLRKLLTQSVHVNLAFRLLLRNKDYIDNYFLFLFLFCKQAIIFQLASPDTFKMYL